MDSVGKVCGIKPKPIEFKKSITKLVEKSKIIQPIKQTNTNSTKILVIEDNLDNMTTISAILKNKYQLIMATDAKDCWPGACATYAQVFWFDARLPHMCEK